MCTNDSRNITKTRSTQRAQTSLAEADHYSHIAHCKNVEPWLWKTTHPPKKKKKKKKVLDHYLHHYLGMLPLLRCFFAHLLVLQYPDHHQNLISSSLYYSGPVHKISSQSVHNFLSYVVHRQTNRQTDKLTNATKNITSFAKARSTQRAQTSLAEADHYSHIAHCKNVEPWLWKTTQKKKKKKKKKRFWIITFTTIWVCYHYYGVFLLIYSSCNTQITTKI